MKLTTGLELKFGLLWIVFALSYSLTVITEIGLLGRKQTVPNRCTVFPRLVVTNSEIFNVGFTEQP